MNYKVIEKDNKKYIACISGELKLSSERDATDFISACWEIDTSLLMIYSEALSEDFFNLRTGLAGAVLQKFINYRIKVATVIENQENLNDRFKEMILESNKRNDFRVFKDAIEAESWLLS